jgi:aromatic-L-amino-acid decarboxylase
MALAQSFLRRVEDAADFDLLAPAPLATVCFRYHPRGIDATETLNRVNTVLMDQLNRTGRLYLTHTKLDGRLALRLVVGQTNVAQRHVDQAWQLITTTARGMTVPVSG